MNLLLHTIALEPARWTPQRTSHGLAELLPAIAESDIISGIEVYEPHLGSDTTSQEAKDAIEANKLDPVILSSYMALNPDRACDWEFENQISRLARQVSYYGFKKVRLFPGQGMNPSDKDGIRVFKTRLTKVAEYIPTTELLLETHDGSLADDPGVITGILEDLSLPNVGLLFQPTFFQNQKQILIQLRIQLPFIRHVHFQNRLPDLSFVKLEEGIIPWKEILGQLDEDIGGTLEFVPKGVCSLEEFDLKATLSEVHAELEQIRTYLA